MPDENTTPQGETPTGEPQEPTAAELKAELEAARKALKSANNEAADRRKKLDAYEKAEEERKSAEMTELDKANKAKQQAEDKATAALKTANDRILKAEFIAEAAKHGIKNPGDAYALAIADGAAVSVDDDGNPVGVAEAVKTLLDAGRLVVSGTRAPSMDGGAGGGDRLERTVQLTDQQKKLAQDANMTEKQYAAYLVAGPGEDMRTAIDEALKPKT